MEPANVLAVLFDKSESEQVDGHSYVAHVETVQTLK